MTVNACDYVHDLIDDVTCDDDDDVESEDDVDDCCCYDGQGREDVSHFLNGFLCDWYVRS